MAKKQITPMTKPTPAELFGKHELNAKTMTLPNGSKVVVAPAKDETTGDPAFHIFAITPDGKSIHHSFLRTETLDAITYLRDRWERDPKPEPQEHDPSEIPPKQ